MYNTYYNITLLNDTLNGLKSDRVLLASSNTSSDSIMFGKDSSNNYGYIIPGADTVVPFKSITTKSFTIKQRDLHTGNFTVDVTLDGYTPIYCGITWLEYLYRANTSYDTAWVNLSSSISGNIVTFSASSANESIFGATLLVIYSI